MVYSRINYEKLDKVEKSIHCPSCLEKFKYILSFIPSTTVTDESVSLWDFIDCPKCNERIVIDYTLTEYKVKSLG